MKTIYEATDRQGLKWFSKKPTFIPLHDVFSGPRVKRLPRNCRIVRKFKAEVTHSDHSWHYGYPDWIAVKGEQ